MLDAFRDRLLEQLGQQRYSTWIEGAIDFQVSGSKLLVQTANAFERDMVKRCCMCGIRAAANETWGTHVEVSYVIDKSSMSEVATTAVAGAAVPQQVSRATPTSIGGSSVKDLLGATPSQQSLSQRGISKQSDWISGIPTAAAETACRRLLHGEFTATPVLLWGAPGVGKSHLLRYLAAATRKSNRQLRVLSLTAEQFLVSFVEAVRGSGLPSFRQKHRGVDLLILDNVQELIGKQRTLEEFQHTIDALCADGARIVVASDRGPNELRELGPELASRMLSGVVVEVGTPDTQMRSQLIRRVATERGLNLEKVVVDRLAGRLVGGAREVTGALHRMELMSEASGMDLDLELADRVANDLNRISSPPVRLDDIQNAVCSVFGLESSLLKSNKRTKAVAEPRMLAMWLARKMTRSAWSEIGDYFGRRSHSTVISAHRRVERLLAKEEPTRLSGPAGDLHEAIRRVEAVLRTA